MSQKTDTQVVIGGKVLTLSGYESAEYQQRIAAYINEKLEEYEKLEAFRLQPSDTKSILVEINIADDYFKANEQISLLESEVATKEKEISDLKHDMVALQMKLDTAAKQVEELQANVADKAAEVMRLETKMKSKHH